MCLHYLSLSAPGPGTHLPWAQSMKHYLCIEKNTEKVLKVTFPLKPSGKLIWIYFQPKSMY